MGKTIGQKIRALRQKQNKSQGKIAEELGISIPAFSKIETGITDINISRLRQIAALFNVSPESIIVDESIDEKLNQLKTDASQQISDLQNEVIKLQKKLIDSYDEIFDLRKQVKKI